jgi:hypothetical protein
VLLVLVAVLPLLVELHFLEHLPLVVVVQMALLVF